MSGWIKMHRDAEDHWISKDMAKLGRWVTLLWMANHEDKKVLIGNQLVELKRGQFVASNSFLAKRWDTSERTVLRFLELLEKDGMLHRYTHRKVTIITICNYEKYQGNLKSMCTDTCTDGAPMEHRWVTETKKNKEEKEIYNTSTAPAHTYTCEEQKFINQYRKEGMWQDVAMILHKPIRDCENLFDRWILEYQHKGQQHRDYTDFKSHFIQWARITISKEKQSNGNDNRTRDLRRSAGVATAEDISQPF